MQKVIPRANLICFSGTDPRASITTDFMSTSATPNEYLLEPAKQGIDPQPESVQLQQIIERHTGKPPSRELSLTYIWQVVLTASPLLMVDLLVTACCLAASTFLVCNIAGTDPYSGFWKQLPAVLLLQSALLSLHGVYPGAGLNPVAELRGLIRSTIISYLGLTGLNVILGQLPRLEATIFATSVLITVLLLPLARTLSRYMMGHFSWWGIRVLVVGETEQRTITCRKLIKHHEWGYRPVGDFKCTTSLQPEASDLIDSERHDDLVEIARRKKAPAILICPSPDRYELVRRLVFQIPRVVAFGDAESPDYTRASSHSTHTYTTEFNFPLLHFGPRLLKRFSDIVVSLIALGLFAVPMGLIALFIKLKSPGPVFFGHKRCGQHGKTFRAWKFRSMVCNADEVLQQYLLEHPECRAEWERDQKLKDDPRVIPGVGKIIRKWSLDELPQFWNVLVGQMSLIGPRPIVESEISKYSDRYYDYSHMTPGITGLWQVSGRNNTTYEERVALDRYYVRNWSIWLDLLILAKTPAAVLTNRGAY
ncbi:hypothetical protein Rcae01_00341 [Novipirellula caenicola]|uniref:Bacterial sugar transferase domain-containing protein n=2 Tax=Novipirellula caenicola TaxID=1536901 RepID=A0ABP9VI82_9BACT